MSDRIRIAFFTDKGKVLCERLKESMPRREFLVYQKGDFEDAESPLLEFCRAAFMEGEPIVFIGATGIAVRTIAPLVKDKLTDPPVVVMDELGMNVISLLSGHYGGGNQLTVDISEALGANPVITTATDINGAFSVDLFARERDLNIANREGIARVSTKALKGKAITLSVKNYPPSGKVDVEVLPGEEDRNSSGSTLTLKGELKSIADPGLILGMGCRKGKGLSDLLPFLEACLEKAGREKDEISAIATIDIKENEPGIVGLACELSVPLITFDAEMLKRVPGEFTPSEFVKDIVGVDNVCERSALAAAGEGGRLILKKQAENGMTIAMAEREE